MSSHPQKVVQGYGAPDPHGEKISMAHKGPLTPEQLANRRATSLRWYHENKHNFSEEKREKMREHSRKANAKYREKNREEVNRKAAERARKRLADDPDYREANRRRCSERHYANRDQILEQRRLGRTANPDAIAEDNARRLAHHYENREHANSKRKSNSQAARVISPWAKFFHSAQQRAKKKGVAFDLTPEWVNARWTGRCEITGIEFRTDKTSRGPGFFSPSLDRVVPEHGYVQSNCRFVLWAVNAMKSEGTDEDMLFVARAIVNNFSMKSSA